MSYMYIVLIPLILYALFNRISFVVAAVKEGDNSKLKASVFFLILVILVATGLVLSIELI